jgi:AcrR family transcriptional regulator
VGFATTHRRFPTRQALVEEVLRDQLSGIAGLTEAAAKDGGDPWETFAGPIRACREHEAAEPGLAGALYQLFDQLLAQVTDPETSARVRAAFDQLAARARTAGALRPDVTLDDVLLLIKGNAGVIANSPGAEVESSRRFVELALDSLRTRPDPASGR